MKNRMYHFSIHTILIMKIIFFGRLLIVPIFYVVLIIICVSGKTAILFKKFNDYRKEKIQVIPIDTHNNVSPIPPIVLPIVYITPPTPPAPPIIDPPSNLNNNCGMNTQRWNHYLCGNSGTIILLFVMFVLLLSTYMFNYIMIDIYNEESAQLIAIFYQFIHCNAIPLIVYLTNEKLYKHVKDELLNVLS